MATVRQSAKSQQEKYVDGLMDCGYSRDKAENLYRKYYAWDRLDGLDEYIESKTVQVRSYPIESYPLKDM